jgi:mono/diheme cytochrome c family protein
MAGFGTRMSARRSRDVAGLSWSQGAKILPAGLPLALICGLSSTACEAAEPAFDAPMTLGGREVPAATLNKGRDLYGRHCVSCHGEQGAGDGPAARNLKFPPRDFRKAEFSFVPAGELPSHEQLVERIRSGVPDRGMPPWKGMRAEDLSALADYIKTFSPKWKAGGA